MAAQFSGKREAVLVIDVGTSKVHANLIDIDDGTLAAEAVWTIPWDHPQAGWTECDPEALWKAVVESVRGAMAAKPSGVDLIAVGTSFQGDGFLLEDAEYRALYPIIVAMDRRGEPYVETFAREFGAERFEKILGCALGAWEPMKYYWMVKNRPELIAKTAHITSVQEYVMRRLGLGYCQDYTLASRKVMRDYRKNRWSEELCAFLKLPEALFDSPVYSSDTFCGEIDRVQDVALGKKVPVLIGAHDCEMGMLGVGVRPDSREVLANVAGTTDHLGFLTTKPFAFQNLPLCIYRGPFDGSFVALGANAVGASVTWGVERLFPDGGDYAENIAALFSRIRFDGKNRVIHTGGIQAASGTFHHVDLQTTREDLFCALVEGVTYPLQAVCRAMEQAAGGAFSCVRIGNGGAKSKNWVQLKADLFNMPVERVLNNEISSVGAALLAGVTLGRYKTLEQAQSAMVHVADRADPNPDTVERYRQRIAEWRSLSTL